MNNLNHKPGLLQHLRCSAPSPRRMRSRPAGVLLLALLGLALSSPAHAAAYCESKIARVYYDKAGSVFMLPYFRNDWLQICNLEVAWKDVPTTTCAAWLTTLTTGMLTGKVFTFHYSDPVTTCSAIPYYSGAPSPSYVMVTQ